MAWTTPGTATAGEVLTAAFWNTNVRDNLSALDAAGANDVGLVHIKTVSASASASPVSVTDCFSSAYANYRVLVDSVPTANAAITLRFRDSGGVISSGNYAYASQTIDSGTGAASQANGRTQTSINIPGGYSTSIRHIAEFDVLGPNLALPTLLTGSTTNEVANAANISGSFTLTTQMTGFDWIYASGNTTGTIRVYGYKNS